MKKSKTIELRDGLKVIVYPTGEIKSTDLHMVRTNGRTYNRKGKILKSKTDKCGYKVINFTHNNKQQTYFVHRLVAKAFIPNPENKETINHIDGNKENNNISNLEWATIRENQIHKWQSGLANYCRNEKGQFTSRKDVVLNE